MTSRYQTETNLENEPTRHPIQSPPTSSEAAYERLTSYGFAQRYAKGKIVANIGWEEVGYGSRLLAETAESVAGLTNSPEAVEQASAAYSAPNANYRRVSLPELPYSEGYFDTIIAFEVAEYLDNPEDLLGEVKRVLKKEGVFVISVRHKQAYGNDSYHRGVGSRRRGMYVSELQELLESYFGHVDVYRQGAVAGGFVFPASEEVTDASIKSARFTLTNPYLSTAPPTNRSVIAVCSDVEDLEQEKQPYLLLDRDRRVFDENEERAEDVELLRSEIRQMQETEVQAFVDALKVQQSLALVLRRYPVHTLNVIYGHIHLIRTESRMYRRLATPYRWLRGKNRELETTPESVEGGNTHRRG